MEMSFVREHGMDMPTGGRRSIFLEFNPGVGVNISVIFNISFLHGALVNLAGEVVFESKETVYNGIPERELLDKLIILIDRLQKHADDMSKRIFGIGIGIGGYLNMDTGISHSYFFSKNWNEIELKTKIEDRYKLPFFLINDIDAGALGDRYYGKGIGVDNFLCLWVSESVGMGIVLNGDIYFGKNGYVGEIGHTRVMPDGPLCSCGNTGCLETVTSENYILKRCIEGVAGGAMSEILKLCNGNINQLKIEHVIEASNNGDKLSRNIFEEAGNYIGLKLADTANILNPELIILRGSVLNGNTYLFETIERVMRKQVLRPIANSIKITYSHSQRSDTDIRLLGVSSYILMKYFNA